MTGTNIFTFAPTPVPIPTSYISSVSSTPARPSSRLRPHPRPRLRSRLTSPSLPKPSIRSIARCKDDDDNSSRVAESGFGSTDTQRGIKRRIWHVDLGDRDSYSDSRKRARKKGEFSQELRSSAGAVHGEEATAGSGLLTPPRSPLLGQDTTNSPPKPSLSSTPAQSPPSLPPHTLRCSHSIHPAYVTEHDGPLCPNCQLVYCTSAMRAATKCILKNVSSDHWLESLISENDWRDWTAFTRGRDKKNQENIRQDRFGNDSSYRHCKMRLHSLLPWLEYLRHIQLVWEQETRSSGSASESAIAGLREHSAIAALAKYERYMAKGSLTRIEEAAAVFNRNRGRELEIAADINYPRTEDTSKEAIKFNRKTLAQIEFVHKSKIPHPTGAGVPYAYDVSSSPKTTRPHTGPNVRFNGEVKVCADSDVDVLRQHASVAATLKSAPSTTRKSKLYTEPKLEYVSYRIKHIDGSARTQGSFSRKGERYRPGTWAVSPGSEPVDTSGSTVKDLQEWHNYNIGLQLEASAMDPPCVHREAFLGFFRVFKWPNRPGKSTPARLGTGFGAYSIRAPFAAMREEWEQIRWA